MLLFEVVEDALHGGEIVQHSSTNPEIGGAFLVVEVIQSGTVQYIGRTIKKFINSAQPTGILPRYIITPHDHSHYRLVAIAKSALLSKRHNHHENLHICKHWKT
jgi:hypothetical protein